MKIGFLFIGIILLGFLVFGCADKKEQTPAADAPENANQNEDATIIFDRESKIPADAVKITPETDKYLPQLHNDGWESPVPVDYPISSKGAEDSPFVMPDGNTLYFFFTPDVRVPVEKQVIDGVTGIYVSNKQNGKWSEPERVVLQDPGKLSLDGCEFVQGNIIWFCAAREGYTGLHWFTATYKNGKWGNWKNSDFNPEWEVGELHISADGNELYYHSPKAGGKGGYDLWMSRKDGGNWQEPEKLEILNTEQTEGWPYHSQDGSELWFTRFYMGSPAIYRSVKGADGNWQEPELILSQFAGEPTLDNDGNIYFTHHFYDNGTMLEADIYIAKKK